MGDVIGDVNARRGMIQGTESRTGSVQVNANIPLSSMFGYATALRSNTQGRGNFVMQMHHYEAAPKMIQEEIIKSRA